ncbi:hypothetical protein [uncultured Tenacibaculum sp.]|uniref:hypothetical protein n=1 Tax=uncultured Tenacibaculum sp. TaxID=174713 RepID=UPI002636A4A0|nr:hypothetical protein [uncultured Tenacibaculum sp.]
MKIVKLTSLLLLILTLKSCYTCWVKKSIPKDVSINIEKCFDSLSTGLDSIIPINGNYLMKYNYEKWNEKLKMNVKDSMNIEFRFFPNGFFSWRNFRDGNYFVKGDTIKAYKFEPPCGQTWGGSEHWFLINQDSSLTYIYYSSLKKEKNINLKKHYETERRNNLKNYSIAKFEPKDTIPEFEKSWLFETEWFECKKK